MPIFLPATGTQVRFGRRPECYRHYSLSVIEDIRLLGSYPFSMRSCLRPHIH